MAFICTLDPNLPLVLTAICSEAGQGETIIRIPVGIDDESEAVFSIFVCLATLPGYGALRHELAFHIIKADDGYEDFYSDGLETLTTISDRIARNRILQVICIATDKLIDEVAPVEVEIITHEANLPRKALNKYLAIGNVFVKHGYVPAYPDPFHGRHIWMFTQP